ncbi:DNA circularization N-terminal domain-containing protein [Bosea sp. (in: a-proteobacteria)]|uniref:DNA circularization N-terminal domain-containing protein n=1 Tax=Bosea sp. (in: a-proteobacteria) TaxID=1871050 RepID=UPI003B3AC7CC
MTTPGGSLRRASFRDASFFAKRDTRSFSRALQIDEFPMSDRWRVTDLGRKAVTGRFDAYVADEVDAAARMRAVEAALEAPGPGLLVLPARRPVMVWARAPETEWSGDKLGWFTLRVEFVEDGSEAIAGPSLGLAERLIVDGLSQVAGLADAAGVALASFAGDARGVSRYESLGFAAESAVRFAGLSDAALALSAADDVVTAAGALPGWQSHADLADALSLLGGPGLGLLEDRGAA